MENKKLTEIYDILLKRFGPQGWWPAKTRFEVVVGAILTQNTNWKNVEKVIGEMERKGLLEPEGLRKISETELGEIVRPVGYYNQKSKKLKNFLEFLFKEYGGSMDNLAEADEDVLRAQLLDLWGVGEETADAILLYAADKPSFVVDAYTKRVFMRMGMLDGITTYSEIKDFFEENLPKDLELYKEFHALIDELAKNYCLINPGCDLCPVSGLCARKMG